MDNSLTPFLISWMISITITPLSIWIMWKWKAVDDPTTHKHIKVVHSYPVPRGGGIPVFFALVVCTFLFLPIDHHSIAILCAGALTLGIGLLDDRYDLSPYLRLFTNVLVALIIVSQGIIINYVTNPFNGQAIDFSVMQLTVPIGDSVLNIPLLAIAITVVWVVGLMNMIGQGAGGIEGQLPGIVIIASIVLAIMSHRFSSDITLWPVGILSLVVSGAYLGFLPYNFFPQRIMPGYSGKSLGGYLLAITAILTTAKVGLLITVLGVPLIDTTITYLRRLWVRKSPLVGDRGHLHHRFLDIGLSKPQIVLIYWILTSILGILALNINSRQKLYALVLVSVFVATLLIGLGRKSIDSGSQKL